MSRIKYAISKHDRNLTTKSMYRNCNFDQTHFKKSEIILRKCATLQIFFLRVCIITLKSCLSLLYREEFYNTFYYVGNVKINILLRICIYNVWFGLFLSVVAFCEVAKWSRRKITVGLCWLRHAELGPLRDFTKAGFLFFIFLNCYFL